MVDNIIITHQFRNVLSADVPPSQRKLVVQPLWKTTAKLIKASEHNMSDQYVRS